MFLSNTLKNHCPSMPAAPYGLNSLLALSMLRNYLTLHFWSFQTDKIMISYCARCATKYLQGVLRNADLNSKHLSRLGMVTPTPHESVFAAIPSLKLPMLTTTYQFLPTPRCLSCPQATCWVDETLLLGRSTPSLAKWGTFTTIKTAITGSDMKMGQFSWAMVELMGECQTQLAFQFLSFDSPFLHLLVHLPLSAASCETGISREGKDR